MNAAPAVAFVPPVPNEFEIIQVSEDYMVPEEYTVTSNIQMPVVVQKSVTIEEPTLVTE